MRRLSVVLMMAVVSAAITAVPLSAADTTNVVAQEAADVAADVTAADESSAEPVVAADDVAADDEVGHEPSADGLHYVLRNKFVEGNAAFMSLVALALVIGLTVCVERIVYLALSETNEHRLLDAIERHLHDGDIDGARQLCRDTRGPVASLCCQALLRIDSDMDEIERSVRAYGTVLTARLENGCSWIRLMIAIAPSLGFLGTVIGMVMAFDHIQTAGDISPTIVAAGMKVALITTIFGIVSAVVLQLFYNYILARIDHLLVRMDESVVALFDLISEHRRR